MAAPRVFVSSTYYDLQHVRNDIRIFLQGLGYEAVMHDKGNIPYTQDESLEDSCYSELDTCDIVVCIIGNKFGTKSSHGDYSITMKELQNAIKSRKKIYIYILKDVYAENFTYIANKDSAFTPYHADDIKIHEFIADLKRTMDNHPIISFETVSDITNNLREQFAGLFQRLLSNNSTITESVIYADLQDSAKSIRDLINDFRDEKNMFFNKFDSSIYVLNPVIKKILQFLGGKKYDVFISNKSSLKQFFNDLGFDILEDSDFSNDLTLSKIENGYKISLCLDGRLFSDSDALMCVRDKRELEQYISFKREPISNGFDPVDDLPF